MNDDDDPLMEWALGERVGGEQPPDLVAAVRARLHEAPVAAPAARLQASQLAAAALVLLGVAVVCGVALWPKPTDVPAAPCQEPKPVHVDMSTDVGSLPADTRAVEASNVDDAKIAELARLRDLEVLVVREPWNESFGLSLKMEKPRESFSTTAASWSTIAGFTKLRRLDLSGVPYVSMLPPRDSGPPVTGPQVADAFAELERLPLLESLTLRFLDTPDEMLEVLPRLQALRHLDLSFNHGFGVAGLRAIAKCRGLRTLSLRGCQQLDDDALSWLGQLTELEEIDLSAIDGINWRAGSAELDPRVNRVLPDRANRGQGPRGPGRATLDEIGSLPKLRVLNVSGAPGLSLQHMAAALHRCASLRALDASGLQDLRELFQPGTRVREGLEGDSWVRALPKQLERLEVCGDQGDDFCVAVAEHLTNLRDLTLAACDRITDTGVRAVAAMPSLRRLDLRQMRGLTAATIDTLAAATQLEELDLRHDDFVTAEHVARLRAALPKLRVLQTNVEPK